MNNYKNFATRRGSNPFVRPNLGQSLTARNGAVVVNGLTIAASSGAKEMLGDPKAGFYPVMLERFKDGTSKAANGHLSTKTLLAMITREGQAARVSAIGPYTCPEIEKVQVGEEFLALGETIKGRKGSFFRVSQIIPRTEFEKLSAEQQAAATAGAKVVNPVVLDQGAKAGASAE
jgi:hypothetical protein